MRRSAPVRSGRAPAYSLLSCLVLSLALAASGCGGPPDSPGHGGGRAGAQAREGQAREPAGEDAIAVRVAPAQLEPLSSLYSTSATLRADRRATVTARTRGVVQRLTVEEGNTVAEDQALAYLEDDEQTIDLEMARTTLDTREREYQRAERLYHQELLSEEDYETIARETEEARQALALSELALSRTIIRAPFGGKVLQRHLDVGATVSDGTALYDLADLDPLYADVNVPERHVARLEPGQAVRITVDATGQAMEARIERIAPAVDPSTGTVKVTLAVDRASGLRPGAFARVDVITDTHTEALVVPRSALVAEGRRWNLFRLRESGDEVEMLEVALGYEEGDRVEIHEVLEDGPPLEPGEFVVVVGASALSDGARVTVFEETPEPAGEEAGEETTHGEKQSGSAGTAHG